LGALVGGVVFEVEGFGFLGWCSVCPQGTLSPDSGRCAASIRG
jgi:hypothetical protein